MPRSTLPTLPAGMQAGTLAERWGGWKQVLRCHDLLAKDAVAGVGTEASLWVHRNQAGLSAFCPRAELALSEVPPPLSLGTQL